MVTQTPSLSLGSPFMELLLGLPFLAAIVVALLPAARTRAIRVVSLLGAVGTLLVAVAMAVAFDSHMAGYQFVWKQSWAGGLGISWLTGVDGISLFVVVLTALVTPLVLLGAPVASRTKSYTAWVLALEGACIGTFVSLDLVLFFLFFELTLIPSYFLIVGWGGRNRSAAATKFFIYTFVGSVFLLVGIVYLAVAHSSATGHLSFSLLELQGTSTSALVGVLLLVAFTFAFAIKAPIFPFHTWSPDAYSEAPPGAAMMLSAIMAKLGTYGLIRFDLQLLPHASRLAAPVLLTLATVSVLYGAIVACGQKDLKRLVAYSSLAQVGFIALGTFAFSTQALSGAVLLMLNHGIITAAFFLLIGWIAERRGTWQLGDLKGLQGPAPVLAALFTVVMLASIGLPGLNNFVSEYLVLLGTFLTHVWWAAVATLGVVASAVYLLWAYQRGFHGRAEGANAEVADATTSERLVIAPLIALIVVLGILPGWALHRIEPSVNRILEPIAADAGCNRPTSVLAPSTARPEPAQTQRCGVVMSTSSSPTAGGAK
jgi:NADH-quinone oxidoreductase subunit M